MYIEARDKLGKVFRAAGNRETSLRNITITHIMRIYGLFFYIQLRSTSPLRPQFSISIWTLRHYNLGESREGWQSLLQ